MRYTQPDDSPEDKPWLAAKWLKSNIPGLLFGREVRYLYTTAQRVGPGLYADLGTFQGLSSGALSKGITDFGLFPDACVYSFDTFEGTGVSKKHHADEMGIETIRNRLGHLDLLENICLYPGTFEESAKLFSPETFSFIFIDGSHDYASVRQDFDTWAPLLKVGGELAFHDSNIRESGKKEVYRLMDEMKSGSEGDWEQVAEERTLSAWIKG